MPRRMSFLTWHLLTDSHTFLFVKFTMKTILIVLVGVLVWTNNDARTFTAKALYRAAEFVSPEPESRSIGETIDEIFSR